MNLIKKLVIASSVSALFAVSGVATDDLVKKGEKIFKTNTMGNCIACHAVNNVELDGPGSMGPKLQYLSAWPEQLLYDTVYDIYSARNLPVTSMPAFGKNGWLSDEEIKAVVAYLKTIN